MRREVNLPGFEQHHIEVEFPGFLKTPKLFADNKLAPSGKSTGTFQLTDARGNTFPVRITTPFFYFYPTLTFQGTKINLCEQMGWHQYLLAFLPLLFLWRFHLWHWLLGTLPLLSLNFRIYRSALPKFRKDALVIAINIGLPLAGWIFLIFIQVANM